MLIVDLARLACAQTAITSGQTLVVPKEFPGSFNPVVLQANWHRLHLVSPAGPFWFPQRKWVALQKCVFP